MNELQTPEVPAPEFHWDAWRRFAEALFPANPKESAAA